MLARVAERVYWCARYLERIENTARLISVYDKLMFDLPRNVAIGWYSIIAINGSQQAFNERYKNHDERNVVKFLIGDDTNVSSIMSCLRFARENLRTTRDVFPAESWEMINELNLFVTENLQQGINRSQRFNFLDTIIKSCQQINGLMVGTMPRDFVWHFMQLGRNIERADMTSRLLEAGVRTQQKIENDADVVNSQQLIWGNVLRSLDADQGYRRSFRASVKSTLVVSYIIEDTAFPRSINYCLSAVENSLIRLPNNETLVKHIKRVQTQIVKTVDYSNLKEPMKKFINQIQLDIADIHTNITENWFPKNY